MTSSSFTPALHQALGFLHHLADRAATRGRRASTGMMQNVQRWLQPSEILR